MVKKFFLSVIILGIALIIYIIYHKDSNNLIDNISFEDTWARPAKAKQNSAAYAIITNNNNKPVKIIKATSDVAETVELHNTIQQGQIYRMQPIKYIFLQQKENKVLSPGGMHIMLIKLKKDLQTDENIKINFKLSSGEILPINFVVKNNIGNCNCK